METCGWTLGFHKPVAIVHETSRAAWSHTGEKPGFCHIFGPKSSVSDHVIGQILLSDAKFSLPSVFNFLDF